jgi:hypothetical protein
MRATEQFSIMPIRLFILLLVGTVAPVRADSPTAESPTNAAPATVEMRQELGAGQSVSERAYLNMGLERFALLVPHGFRGRATAAVPLMLITTNSGCVFTLRSLGPLEDNQLDPERARARVLTTYDNGQIVQEFSRAVNGRTAFLFDVSRLEQGVPRKVRIAYLPSRQQLLQLCMSCNQDDFARGCQALNTIFATFRIGDEKGELRVSPLSDRL